MSCGLLAAASAAAAAGVARGAAIGLNFSSLGVAYTGVGALSGGGGDSRFMIDYPAPQQQDILDILFKPNAGASLQILKVEIGGDTQSTEGVEQSHERFRGDLNCSRGYEWWLLAEAKKRNPGIKTYGLSWGVPGWIGDGNYFSQDNIQYHVDWVACADNTYGIHIDYMGIWNERSWDATWIKQLRVALDEAGYQNTRIVAADGDWSVSTAMLSDPELAAAVDIVGAHYPSSAPPSAAVANLSSNHLFWASEMWNLGQHDDWAGAGYLASDLARHASYGLSSSIVWCLIYSWFQSLNYATSDGTNSGSGHSLMTASEPWSGYYEVNPTLAAVAHWTQFTQRGWTFLSLSGGGGWGNLPSGGQYVTLVDTHTPASVLSFSLIIETMQGATAAQTVSFQITGLASQALPAALHVWLSTQSALMAQQADVPVDADGVFTLTIPVSAMMSVTTTTGQGWVTPAAPVPPSAPFPFPYSETFDSAPAQGYARYFSDMGGVWVANPLPAELLRAGGSGQGYQQVVPQLPIAWVANPNPFTLVGNFNPNTYADLASWTDYTLEAVGALDASAAPAPSVVTFQQTCSGAASQTFAVVNGSLSPSSPAMLQSVAYPDLCVGLAGPETDPQYPGSTRVALLPCARAAAWALNASTMQLYSGGLCLDVYGQNASLGARTIAWPCETPPGPNERWATRAGGGGVALVAQQTGFCVGLTSVGPAAQPFLWTTIRMSRQGWTPLPAGVSLYLYASPNATAAGSWRIATDAATLGSGAVPFPVTPATWYNVTLVAAGAKVAAYVNGQLLDTVVAPNGYSWGGVTIGSGWHSAWYDSVVIRNNTVSP